MASPFISGVEPLEVWSYSQNIFR